ncbi:MAG: S1C family serine protease [Clostridia bacterium]|nr:S1C family serine protease [Clostridia bacterium]
MAKKFSKIIAAVLVAAMCLSAVFLSSCISGKDGEDGKDLDIYDVYSAVCEQRDSAGLDSISFLEFIEEYFGYVSDQAVTSADKTAIMNYSLLSGVAIWTQFKISEGHFAGSSTYDLFAGSGVIIDVDKDAGDAYIVTNAHVVYDSDYSSNDGFCEEIYLYLYGSDVEGVDYAINSNYSITNYSGISAKCVKVIGVSLLYDIAVLKVTGSSVLKNSNAVAAKFSTDANVYVGEEVYTVGNPSYEGLSVMQGIISRDTETIYVDVDDDSTDYYTDYESFRVFRTTTAINGGNSGGAVYNMSGEIIGIGNATSLTEDNLVQDMCYALPANNVRRIAQSMIDNYEENDTVCHYLSKATIGVTTEVDAESTYAEYDADTGRTVIHETVQVASVLSEYAAYNLLSAGDTLVSYSIGKMTGSAPSSAQTERASGFSVPSNSDYITDSRYCDTVEITRSFMLSEGMISVRVGDTVELVIERDNTTYYTYFTFDDSSYFTQYE